MGLTSAVGIGAMAYLKVKLSVIVAKGILFAVSSVLAGVAIDVGIQSIMIGIQGGSAEDINWKRAMISSAFNLLSFGADKLFKTMTIAKNLIKGVSLTVLEGFINYAIEVACGSSQEVAWQEFGWGILFGFIFNSISLMGNISQYKKFFSNNNNVVEDVGNVSNKLNDQLKELPEDINKRIKNARKYATVSAKNQELQLLQIQMEFYDKYDKLPNGVKMFGSAQNFTYDQVVEFLKQGKLPDTYGHHIKNVQSSIDKIYDAYKLGDNISIDKIIKNEIKNRNNIVIGFFEDHLRWHNNNFRNYTNYVIICGQRITNIDRQQIINHIKGLI